MPATGARARCGGAAVKTAYPGAPPAVVVGLCSHGLATVRALASHGIEVYALDKDLSLPAAATRRARVRPAGAFEGEGLVASLRALAREIGRPAVLYLMNDRMVRTVARHWPELAGDYLLSWAEARETVAALLEKSTLAARCEQQGLDYPGSAVLASEEALEEATARLEPPYIVKPVSPLGPFKAARVADREQLRALVRSHGDGGPLLVQQWIDGGDQALYFCALYLEDGEIVARFDGHKLASWPPALGQTLAAESRRDDAVFAAAERFFAGLRLSGPVSLEVKRGQDGRLWVIEPTVGRTDFWLPLCVANGVDLPYIEYGAVTGAVPDAAPQRFGRIWMDTEKDPLCYLRVVRATGRLVPPQGLVPSYWRLGDMGPFRRAVGRLAGRGLRALRARARKRAPGADVPTGVGSG